MTCLVHGVICLQVAPIRRQVTQGLAVGQAVDANEADDGVREKGEDDDDLDVPEGQEGGV